MYFDNFVDTPQWVPGLSWLHYEHQQDISYVYINIPKNASSWMKENFGGYRYDWYKNEFTQSVDSSITFKKALNAPKHHVVILRDPIERWISGFAQAFWGRNTDGPDYYRNTHPTTWFEKICYDIHTKPQIEFLVDLDYESTTWFDCDANLTDNVKSWMERKFDHRIKDISEDDSNAYNVSKKGNPWPTTGVRQQDIIDDVNKILESNVVYKEKLVEFYQKDIKLRKSVVFYGSR